VDIKRAKEAFLSDLPFESFTLNFCIVLLKSLLISLEPHFISSEASRMFVKIKQKLCAK